MKSILLSLMVVALVGGLAGGGMFAYFSDTETSTGNTFTAGTIDIDLSGDVDKPVHGSLQTEFKPCETGHLNFTVTNVGQNPADVWKFINNIVPHEGGTTEPEDAWYSENHQPGRNLAPEEVWFDLTVDGVVKIADGAKTLQEIMGKYIYLGRLAPAGEPGSSMTVEQSFHIKAEVGNWAQSDFLSFDEDFYALQTVGGAPAPSPELPGFERP